MVAQRDGCCRQLARVVRTTGCRVVLSSSWRNYASALSKATSALRREQSASLCVWAVKWSLACAARTALWSWQRTVRRIFLGGPVVGPGG